MKFLVDSADLNRIRDCYEHLACDGVTTNPSILAKNGTSPYTALREIRNFIGNDSELHVQIISCEFDTMLREATVIAETLGKNTYIKIPVTKTGLKAIKALKAEGFNITATAIYTAAQAYLAAQAGADYVAPYVNRIYDTGADGVEITKQIEDILRTGGYKTQVLAASFKNVSQLVSLAAAGIDAATVQPDIISKMVNNPTVDAAVEAFRHDFEGIAGVGSDMTSE